LQLSVSDLWWYAVALLFMRKLITQIGIFVLLLFHFGCSGVQERTAFGGGFTVSKPQNLDLLDSGFGEKQTIDFKTLEVPQSVEKENKLTFSQKVEQHMHKRNQKVWFESGRLPKKVQKLKPIRQYKEFLKTGQTLAESEGNKKGTTLLIIGLGLGLLGYLMFAAADNGWFGLGLGGSNFNGCFVILLGLIFLIAAAVLLIVGLVMSLS
jgi:hypothetical protein